MMALPIDGAPGTVVSGDLSVSAPALNRTGTALGFAVQDFDRALEPFVTRLGATTAPQKVATVQPSFTAPLGRSLLMAAVGLVAALWALASLIAG